MGSMFLFHFEMKKKRKFGQDDIAARTLDQSKRKTGQVNNAAGISEGQDDPPVKKQRTNRKRAERIDSDRYYNRHVIKCTLGPLCKFQIVRDEIEQAVYWLSRLQIHAHHVMTLFVVRNNGHLPSGKNLYGSWNSLMRDLANCLSNKTRRGDYSDLCDEYCAKAGLDRNWPDDVTSLWRGKLLDQLAKASATVHSNHLKTNHHGFVKRYANYLISEDDRYKQIKDLDTAKFKKAFGLIADSLDLHATKTVEEIICLRPKTEKALPRDHGIWIVVQDLVNELRVLYRQGMSEDDISSTLFRILPILEDHSQTLRQRWESGTPSTKKMKKQRWAFAICPQMQWRPKHLLITTTAVKALLEQLAKSHSYMKTLLQECRGSINEEDEEWDINYRYWDALFDLKRIVRKKHQTNPHHLRFGNFIATDGVSVSCVFQKRKSKRECEIETLKSAVSSMKKAIKEAKETSENDVPEEDDAEYKRLSKFLKDANKEMLKRAAEAHSVASLKDIVDLEEVSDGAFECTNNRRIIAIDPGMTNPVTWVEYHSPYILEKYESGTIYGGWWRFESGQKQFTKKQRKRMDRFCPELKNAPSTKTACFESLIGAYRFQAGLWSKICPAYFGDEKWFQKQRMRMTVRRQKAMERVVSILTGTSNKRSQSDVIIAHGDGDMRGCMRGVPPVMSSKLTRKLCHDTTLVFVNEYRTSMLCHHCHEVLHQDRRFRIKTCTNKDCVRTVLNRDVNAAINILYNFMYELYHGARHGKFKRNVVES